MWQRVLRIFLATLFAPWVTVLAVALHAIVAGNLLGHESWEMSLNFGPFALYGMIITYPATIILGVPLHLILSHFRVGFIWTHALLGGVLAFLIGVFYFNLLPVEDWNVFLIYSSLIVLPGILVAAAFGAIAGKPQRESAR